MRYNNVCCLMPNYNNGKYIEQAINSIGDKCDILVVDDKSKDNSVELIKNLKVNSILKKDNSGVSETRNIGLEWILKNGYEYTLLLDSDDFISENFLEETYPYIQKENCLAVYGDYYIYYNETQNSVPEYKMSLDNTKLWRECLMPHQALVDNKVFKEIFKSEFFFYDKDLKVCNDYDMDLKINQHGYIKHVPKFIGYVREGSNNQCSNIHGEIRMNALNKLRQNNKKYYLGD